MASISRRLSHPISFPRIESEDQVSSCLTMPIYGPCGHTESHNCFPPPSFLRPNSTSMVAREEASSLRPPSRTGVEGERPGKTASAASVAQFVHPLPPASPVVLGYATMGNKSLLSQTCHIVHAGRASEESQGEQGATLSSESFSRVHWEVTFEAKRIAEHYKATIVFLAQFDQSLFQHRSESPVSGRVLVAHGLRNTDVPLRISSQIYKVIPSTRSWTIQDELSLPPPFRCGYSRAFYRNKANDSSRFGTRAVLVFSSLFLCDAADPYNLSNLYDDVETLCEMVEAYL
ncbi:hypothetical protein EDB81DRAFT_763431 [Dactylonectria macrodidyma]|uniref:Uncharacterized protein n=1 Tax=Dactylonectria macrodidyma TaxID=307937 RepID=A0A9P9IVW2_9HYPO|nr:hypothetical protein EDB81DRAFT_763431 [Dactylonectria macrodidyma]